MRRKEGYYMPSKTTLKRNGQSAQKTLSESPKQQRRASTRNAPESTVNPDAPVNEITLPAHTPGV